MIEISDTTKRERLAGEIRPVKAEHSSTLFYQEEEWGAGNAIDLDLETTTFTQPDSDGALWIQITLEQVYCVEQILHGIR